MCLQPIWLYWDPVVFVGNGKIWTIKFREKLNKYDEKLVTVPSW